MIGLLLKAMRPKQWIKNLLLFAGILFSQKLLDGTSFLKAFLGFAAFCMLSSAEYLVNDLLDLEKDRSHPVKKHRPLASGAISPAAAIALAVVLFAAGLLLAFRLRPQFGWVALFYAVMMLAYSFRLKHIVIVDVIIIASGFVMRAIAGALVVNVTISSWLLVCTIFGALFLGMCKRRYEIVLMGEEARNHRKILGEYTPYLLDQMISVVTASTVMAYALYTMAGDTIQKFGSRNLVFTIPFVLYGIFRYLYLVHQKNMGGSPEMIFLKDRSMIVNICLYLITAGVIIYSH